jgi:hypothetical protein
VTGLCKTNNLVTDRHHTIAFIYKISNFEKRLVTSKNIHVFIFLFSKKNLKEA